MQKKKNHITRCLQKGGVPVAQQYYQRPKFCFASHTVKYNIDLLLHLHWSSLIFIARWLTQLQTLHPPKAISKDQSKKKNIVLPCVYLWDEKTFTEPCCPQTFLHSPGWCHMPIYEPVAGHGSRITMNGLKYSGFTLPVQWGGGEGLYSLKVMATGYPTKPEIDWWIKKRKVAIR